ncbi:MAG: homoserine dehydrogenase, partial [Acidimicrobiales bacterium]|nr:homoserine dehydrogenase [Acidimicrobiales bacterium]
MSQTTVRIGLLGCGNVGSGLLELLSEEGATIAARSGIDLRVTAVAVRSTSKDRGIDVGAASLTADAMSVVTDPDIDVVVEVIGGIEPARELILAALAAGKPVVTANKELLANHGAEMFAA